VKSDHEYDAFNAAMETILRADPKVVKAAMDEAKRERAVDPQPKNAFAPRRASSGKD
jgi:hypothetical protein